MKKIKCFNCLRTPIWETVDKNKIKFCYGDIYKIYGRLRKSSCLSYYALTHSLTRHQVGKKSDETI